MLLLFYFLSISTIPSYACTEWSATGERVEGGGSLLTKNRDWTPNQTQILKLETPEKGYRYFGLFLENIRHPFSMNDFITLSEDQADGPDNSIWRIGSSPQKERTLATFIVQLPLSGSPLLYIKVANPGQEPQYYHLRADDIFSGKTEY